MISWHCSDVTWVHWHPLSPVAGLLVQEIIQSDNNENIIIPHLLVLCEGIPLTRGPVMWKIFPRHDFFMMQWGPTPLLHSHHDIQTDLGSVIRAMFTHLSEYKHFQNDNSWVFLLSGSRKVWTNWFWNTASKTNGENFRNVHQIWHDFVHCLKWFWN